MDNHLGTKAGTAGGTLISIAVNLGTGDLIRTAVLAAVGAMVSFGISLFLKWLLKCIRKREDSG